MVTVAWARRGRAALSMLVLLASAGLGNLGLGLDAQAQSDPVSPHIQRLSLPPRPAGVASGEPTWLGTGFYVNNSGAVMTAAHVVESCRNLLVVKDGFHIAPGSLVYDKTLDLAVLTTDRIRGIPAVFQEAPEAATGGVYVAGWIDLFAAAPRSAVLSNALTLQASPDGAALSPPGRFALTSTAQAGASGAPVIDRDGLVVGVLQSRLSPGRGNTTATAHRTFAADLAHIKAFMAAAGVPLIQSRQAQLDRVQSRRDRAASFTVGLYCETGRS